jgi:hypothetical protein
VEIPKPHYQGKPEKSLRMHRVRGLPEFPESPPPNPLLTYEPK